MPCSLPVSRLTTEHPTIPEGKLRPDIGRGNWSSMSGFQGRRGAGVLWGLFGIGIPTRGLNLGPWPGPSTGQGAAVRWRGGKPGWRPLTSQRGMRPPRCAGGETEAQGPV